MPAAMKAAAGAEMPETEAVLFPDRLSLISISKRILRTAVADPAENLCR